MDSDRKSTPPGVVAIAMTQSPKNRLPRQLTEGLPWIGGSILLQTAAAVFGKLAALASAGQGFTAIVLNPWYATVLLALGLQAICWVQALRRVPLSVAYPFMSMVLPLNLGFSHLLFRESLQWTHAVGMLFLVLGIALLMREEA